ncbi:hypothetical protein GCM10023324_49140 [Streptomyces youssoufiensis]
MRHGARGSFHGIIAFANTAPVSAGRRSWNRPTGTRSPGRLAPLNRSSTTAKPRARAQGTRRPVGPGAVPRASRRPAPAVRRGGARRPPGAPFKGRRTHHTRYRPTRTTRLNPPPRGPDAERVARREWRDRQRVGRPVALASNSPYGADTASQKPPRRTTDKRFQPRNGLANWPNPAHDAA